MARAILAKIHDNGHPAPKERSIENILSQGKGEQIKQSSGGEGRGTHRANESHQSRQISRHTNWNETAEITAFLLLPRPWRR
jgi:hypothetical protein